MGERLYNIKIFIMKKLFKRQTYIFLFLFALLGLTRQISLAQDSAAGSSSSTITTTTTQHSSTVPSWVWFVGGAILLGIIIAVARGNKTDANSQTDKVTYTKTTSRDTV